MIVPVYKGLSIDTRTLQPGNLFVAIRGDQFDGHDFIEEAVQKGAVGVVVDNPVKSSVPVIQVNDTTLAVGELAHQWRLQFDIPIIGLTGSNGKTTTKNMMAAIFKAAGLSVLATEGNLNNHWGVPIMLSRLASHHNIAIIEMGMNHFGEIAYLTKLVKPSIAVILNAGPCHLEGVGGTIEGVAKAKAEIFEGLSHNGIAVINSDDAFFTFWENYINNIAVNTKKNLSIKYFNLDYPVKNINNTIPLKLLGNHNIHNAQAASMVGLLHNIDITIIKKALENLPPEHGRMETKSGKYNAVIIDDSYNANPLSLKVALEYLHENKTKNITTILVLGDMRELGEHAVLEHHASGRLARESGVDMVLAIGELTQHTINSFGKNGHFFDSQENLVTFLLHYLEQDHNNNVYKKNIVLIKGSRSMKMENIVNKIIVQKTALIIDDMLVYREAIKHCLEKAGYEKIIEAQTGEEGIKLYHEFQKNQIQIDLITMDFQMPGLNGVQTAQQIWELDPNAHIVGLSASPAAMRRACQTDKVDLTVLSKEALPDVLEDYLCT